MPEGPGAYQAHAGATAGDENACGRIVGAGGAAAAEEAAAAGL